MVFGFTSAMRYKLNKALKDKSGNEKRKPKQVQHCKSKGGKMESSIYCQVLTNDIWMFKTLGQSQDSCAKFYL